MTRAPILRWDSGFLIFSGLAALAWVGASFLETRLYQEQAAAAFRREILLRPAVGPAPRPGTLLGSISIPRLRLSSVIAEGTDEHTLALSVGHIEGTALPGGQGNVGLAAHRDTLFRGLRNIRENDDILLATDRGTRIYEVEATRIVAPEDVSVLKEVGRPRLTLVTCYPFYYIGPAPKRFIVQAHLVAR